MPAGDGVLSPDDAFWLLGEETRVAILRAVWESDDDRITFSAIRDRLGNPDSGQFNYHLDKLTGHFLTRADDGYALTQAGREVVRAIMAGTLTDRPEVPPGRIDGDCVHCGANLVARYDEYGIVECGSCGETVMWNEFPPAGVTNRSPAAFAGAFDRWVQSRFQLAMEGVCPNCAVGMTSEIHEFGKGGIDQLTSSHECPNCKFEARVPLVDRVMTHPAVIAFYYEIGVDITTMPYWEWRTLTQEITQERLSVDPWRATVTIRAEGRTLELILNDELDVIDVSNP